jgi:hypothetical protein
MSYMFLDNNKLVVIDYIPGSSGRLLMRLMAEVDRDNPYSNEKIWLEGSLSDHPASREIDFDTLPKKYIEWYWHKQPAYDINVVFDQIGCLTYAIKDRKKFFIGKDYEMKNRTVYFGCHSWDYEVGKLDKNIRCISIVPQTERGEHYQKERARLCWPDASTANEWNKYIDIFNDKQHQEKFDFLTYLVDNNTYGIVKWLRENIPNYNENKTDRIKDILEKYYKGVVNYV